MEEMDKNEQFWKKVWKVCDKEYIAYADYVLWGRIPDKNGESSISPVSDAEPLCNPAWADMEDFYMDCCAAGFIQSVSSADHALFLLFAGDVSVIYVWDLPL